MALLAVVAGGAAVLLGSSLHGVVGFGMGLVALPILGLTLPEHMPQALLVTAVPLNAAMAYRERAGRAPWSTVVRLSSGWTLGVVVTVPVITRLPIGALQILFGVAMFVALAAVIGLRRSIHPGARGELVGGTVAGIMGTTVGLAGPPLALMYERVAPATLRSNLAATLLVGNVLSLAGLAIGGRLSLIDLAIGAALCVPMVAGLALSSVFARRVDTRLVRALVLGVAAFGGLALLVRGLGAL